jgi:hypothetical protein
MAVMNLLTCFRVSCTRHIIELEQYFVPYLLQDRMLIAIIHGKTVRPSREVPKEAHHNASRPFTRGVRQVG